MDKRLHRSNSLLHFFLFSSKGVFRMRSRCPSSMECSAIILLPWNPALLSFLNGRFPSHEHSLFLVLVTASPGQPSFIPCPSLLVLSAQHWESRDEVDNDLPLSCFQTSVRDLMSTHTNYHQMKWYNLVDTDRVLCRGQRNWFAGYIWGDSWALGRKLCIPPAREGIICQWGQKVSFHIELTQKQKADRQWKELGSCWQRALPYFGGQKVPSWSFSGRPEVREEPRTPDLQSQWQVLDHQLFWDEDLQSFLGQLAGQETGSLHCLPCGNLPLEKGSCMGHGNHTSWCGSWGTVPGHFPEAAHGRPAGIWVKHSLERGGRTPGTTRALVGLVLCLSSQVLIFSPFQFSLSGLGFVIPSPCFASFPPSLFLFSFEQEHFGKDKSTEFQLFASPHGKDLLFTDATRGFLRIPPKMDAKLYVGYEYFAATQHQRRGV